MATTKTLHACRCGCKTKVRATFAPGHDARYSSQIRQRYEAGRLSRDKALELATAVSPLFLSKVTRALAIADEKKAKKSKAEAPKDDAAA